MHGAGARLPFVGRLRRAGFRTLHGNSGMLLEGVRNEAKREFEKIPQILGERRLTAVRLKERNDDPQLFDLIDRISRGTDSRLVVHGAYGTLKLVGIDSGHLAVVVEVIERLVDAREVLQVGKDQELAGAKPLGLIDRDRRFRARSGS